MRRIDESAVCDFSARAALHFDVTDIRDLNELIARMRASGAGAIGVALRGSPVHFLITLRDRDAMAIAMPSAPPEVRALDVSILHALVFERIFAITPDDVRKGGNVEYTISASDAIGEVTSGAAAAAFIMNAPTIADVDRVSRAGATMPEKSTYFFPKLATGLVMNPLFD